VRWLPGKSEARRLAARRQLLVATASLQRARWVVAMRLRRDAVAVAALGPVLAVVFGRRAGTVALLLRRLIAWWRLARR
jgi:hypothetical protein